MKSRVMGSESSAKFAGNQKENFIIFLSKPDTILLFYPTSKNMQQSEPTTSALYTSKYDKMRDVLDHVGLVGRLPYLRRRPESTLLMFAVAASAAMMAVLIYALCVAVPSVQRIIIIALCVFFACPLAALAVLALCLAIIASAVLAGLACYLCSLPAVQKWFAVHYEMLRQFSAAIYDSTLGCCFGRCGYEPVDAAYFDEKYDSMPQPVLAESPGIAQLCATGDWIAQTSVDAGTEIADFCCSVPGGIAFATCAVAVGVGYATVWLGQTVAAAPECLAKTPACVGTGMYNFTRNAAAVLC